MLAQTPETQDEVAPAHHPAAALVLQAADELEDVLGNNLHDLDETGELYCVLEQIPTIMRREAHLCTARYLEMLQSGLPADTAEMLAQDDMGFQLVRGLVTD